MRVYLLGRFHQVREVKTQDAARWFVAWLLDHRNPALGDQIQRWLWQPPATDAGPDAGPGCPSPGGLGGIVESAADLARLRTEVVRILRAP